MAKSAFAGEMRTKIRIQGQEAGINARGYPDTAWKDLFPGPVWSASYAGTQETPTRLQITNAGSTTANGVQITITEKRENY